VQHGDRRSDDGGEVDDNGLEVEDGGMLQGQRRRAASLRLTTACSGSGMRWRRALRPGSRRQRAPRLGMSWQRAMGLGSRTAGGGAAVSRVTKG
jgi:hypothetical protein